MLVGKGGGCQRFLRGGEEIWVESAEGGEAMMARDWVDGYLLGVFYLLAFFAMGLVVWLIDLGVRAIGIRLGREGRLRSDLPRVGKRVREVR
jgi:hypothetical protein